MTEEIAGLVKSLRAAAMEATPGPWKLREFSNIFGFGTALDGAEGRIVGNLSHILRKEDHAYFVAASPAAILKLLDYFSFPEVEGWIEIKEGCEMPKNGHDMLVVRTDRAVEKGYYFACNSPIDGWYVGGDRVEGVTHYMPLPAPPDRNREGE
jgi:hypothetical protein